MGALLPPLVSCHGSEKAQGMIEYALIAAFICGVAAVVFAPDNSVWTALQDVFSSVSSKAASAAGN